VSDDERNVFGEPLEPCETALETGFLRDGHCRHVERDPGRHEVCAVMTQAFLEYSRQQGNDLVTPRPELQFPGLHPGDRWCVCIPRWIEAKEAGNAPPVVLEATTADVLDEVSLETLEEYAIEEAGDSIDGYGSGLEGGNDGISDETDRNGADGE
jgi:uncharacterized protein (DUF2237 family)